MRVIDSTSLWQSFLLVLIIYDKGVRTTHLAGPQEWNEHRDTTAIGPVVVLAELNHQKAFLRARFQPHAETYKRYADQSRKRSLNGRCRYYCCDNARINRMAHKGIWPSINYAVSFLSRDRA